MYNITVVKRDGAKAKLDLNQIQRVVDNACEGIDDVSALMVVLNAQIQFEDGISTANIQRVLINSAVDLITEEEPNYQFVAGRLVVQNLRKEVFGRWEPVHWREHVDRLVTAGVYERALLDSFSEEDLETINGFLVHDRDLNFTFGGIEQVQAKYLMRNRVTQKCYETPQMVYMRIACSAYASLEGQERLDAIKDMYDKASTWEFSLPSPIMYSAGGPVRQGSSCVGIRVGDDLASIIEAGGAIVRYSAKRAGIGFDIGSLRAEGYGIRGGEARATGLIPYLKKFRGDLKSCAQGGVRGASATAYYPIFHPEVMNLLVLKNNKGTEESRERQLDYGLQINKVMMSRLLEGKDITLFCRFDHPEMYEAFFKDVVKFEELYLEFEAGRGKNNKRVKAFDVWSLFMGERFDVGRIYPMFVDNVNYQGPFLNDVIYHSNLCAEIALPSFEFFSEDDRSGRVFLCTLACLNWGRFSKPEEMRDACRTVVRYLDTFLSYQSYPQVQAEEATLDYRPLGIGIINYAYFLAKNQAFYGDEKSLAITKLWMEHMAFYLTEASVELAAERGACRRSADTCYGQGIFPWERRKAGVNELTSFEPTLPWEELRVKMKKYGIRNGTLMAFPPAETSSQPAGATNGIEPPQELISEKVSKDGVVKHVVPELSRLREFYVTKFNTGRDGCLNYLKCVAVMQAYVDQSISANTSYNPHDFPSGKIPFNKAIYDMFKFYSWGGKTLYYNLLYDGDKQSVKKEEVICDSCIV